MRCNSPRRHCGFNPHQCRHASQQAASGEERSIQSAPPVLIPTDEQGAVSRSERHQRCGHQPSGSPNRGHHGHHGGQPYHKGHGHHEYWGHHNKHGHHGHHGHRGHHGHHGGHHGHGHGHGQCSEGSCFVTCA